MDRTLLETVHFLGLDVEVAIVAVMAALEGLLRLAEYLRAERRARRPVAREESSPVATAWPPDGWRSNH
jgi:hypothetical protein